MNLTLTRWKVFVIVFLLWAGIYLPSLGSPEFKGEEGRRVLPAVTMLETGNWIVPSVGGEDYYNKPPGINWLVAISFWVTGAHSELAARLVSAFFVLFFVSLLFLLPCRWLSLSGRLISAIIFLTSISMVEKGRLIEIEAVYVSLTGIATLWWLSTWSSNGSKWSLWIVPSLVLGFGVLVKGPFILLFFYCAVTATLVYCKRFRALFSIQHILGVSIILIMALGWAYLAYQRTEGSRMTAQITSEVLIHSVEKLDLARYGWTIVRAFGNFLPWLIFVPALFQKRLTSRIEQQHTALFKGCRLGLIISFILINLMPAGQSRYSLPALALASILLGWVLSLHSGFVKTDRVWRNVLLGGFFVSCLSAIAGLIVVTRGPAAIIVSAVTICTAVIILRRRLLVNNVVRLSVVTAILTVVVMLQYAVFAVPIIKEHQRRRPAAQVVNKMVPAGETVYVYRPGYQAFLFYVRPPLQYALTPDEVDSNVRYLLLEDEYLQMLKDEADISSRSMQVLHKFSDDIKGEYRLVHLE